MSHIKAHKKRTSSHSPLKIKKKMQNIIRLINPMSSFYWKHSKICVCNSNTILPYILLTLLSDIISAKKSSLLTISHLLFISTINLTKKLFRINI